MEFSAYEKTVFDGVRKYKNQLYINAVLVIIVFLLTFKVLGQHERLIIIPPHLSEKVVLAYEEANKPYFESYGFYVANLLGNVSPGNSRLVVKWLEMSFSSSLYQDIKEKILSDAINLEDSGQTVSFSATGVVYDPRTGITKVFGQQEIKGFTGTPTMENVVYEMQIEIKNGLPVIVDIDFYAGDQRGRKK